MTGKVVHVLSGQPYDVYIGRAVPRHRLTKSSWANPYSVKAVGRENALVWFEQLARENYAGRLHRVRAKTLACWCPPKDGHLTTEDETICHGQILLRLAEEMA